VRNIILIGIGGFIGSCLRFYSSQFFQSKSSEFPSGTFIVNLAGCFLIGLFFGLMQKFTFSSEWKLFIATGLLGGFTTFSAFSFESFQLFREGQLMLALSYIFSSIVFGLALTFAGYSLVKFISS
jgi:CrcB protein